VFGQPLFNFLSLCLILSLGVFHPAFATVDRNGQVTSNLSLTTQTLSYEAIRNRENSTNLSASLSVSASEVQDKQGKPDTETSTSGSVGFGFSDISGRPSDSSINRSLSLKF
jgi:hypothetical protein